MKEILREVKTFIQACFTIDVGPPEAVIILAGMGRSGTSWAAGLINYDQSYRILFEPFCPWVVKEARPFEYMQYINPQCQNPILVGQAKKILSGRPRNYWVDCENPKILYRRRIIKEIRGNLMLGWLKKISPQTPIVLMIRHPLAVTASWLHLGWGQELKGKRSEFSILTSKKVLLKDFPIIGEVMEIIDQSSLFEQILFQWCVFYYVPFRTLIKRETFLLFYENLILDPENELKSLFQYLAQPYDWERVHKIIRRASSTNYLKRDFNKDRSRLLTGWKARFSEEQIQRARTILAMFELDQVYDVNGYPADGDHFRCRYARLPHILNK
jgi:hypothetical protein